jgi:hypothetical protein
VIAVDVALILLFAFWFVFLAALMAFLVGP